MQVSNLITEILKVEGWPKYTNDPADSGGPTKGGITLATLADYRKHRVTAEDVKNLTEEEARSIYLEKYWIKPKFDQVAIIDVQVAEELADTGVNMGPGTAVKFLQRILTGFNNQQKLYPDLKVDGQLGTVTLNALQSYLTHRGKEGKAVLLFSLDALQAVRYIEIVERREKDEAFVYGQILNRSAMKWLK
jgi:lysozyme family protein